MTAMVTRVKGRKLLVLSENDREISISAGRVLHESDPGLNSAQPRTELIRNIKEISKRRDAFTQEVDLAELWELLDGEGEDFAFDFLADLVWPGPVDPDHVAAALRAIFSDGLLFKLRAGRAMRNSAEKVAKISEERARDEKRERELSQGGTWLAEVWAGDTGEEPACRDRVVRVLRDMAVFGSDAAESKWGRKLLEQAGLGSYPMVPFHLLVKLGEMDTHENLDMIRQDLATTFPDPVLAGAEALAREAAWLEEDRRDLTDLEIITADSGGARDFDDAVSLEDRDGRLVLGIHIADVAGVIKPKTALDMEAMSRATSIYMPDQRIPMLPEILSEECLSLKQGIERPAFSLLVEITGAGEVLDYEFTPSLIKVKRQLSYQEVDESVGHDLLLGRLFALSQALKSQRTAHGALILPLPKLNVYLAQNGEIGVNLTLWDNPGRSMITEFMILANNLAARRLTEMEAPGFYRSQNEPSKRIIQGDSDCSDLLPCLKQRRFLARAKWSLEPSPHRGMGLDVYTYVTSPLRRYIDLIMQRQVRSLVSGGPALYSQEEAAELLTLTDTVVRRVNSVQTKRRRYWLLRYFESQIRKEYEALVLEKFPRRWRIFLVELMLDVDLPDQPGLDLKPGEMVTVRVKKVDAREDVLKFELV